MCRVTGFGWDPEDGHLTRKTATPRPLITQGDVWCGQPAREAAFAIIRWLAAIILLGRFLRPQTVSVASLSLKVTEEPRPYRYAVLNSTVNTDERNRYQGVSGADCFGILTSANDAEWVNRRAGRQSCKWH